MSYILNVTINIEDQIHDTGIHWIKTRFIPRMMKTDKFTEALLTRVLVNEETGGRTYAIQFKTASRAQLKAYYIENDAEIFRSFHEFGGKIVFFRTEMKIIAIS